ncbi:META domain-containing protein [Leucobacter luti]|uniref:META domain-containing protein n=1 Tax=Leucobacter luti TaxID=340320 RepID=A0A4Q7TZD3_9MICO|nr:META domain-containing protein [Leucobacter luti]MBL3698612.1 META domain-containing protein [Leucobacter luti]RZT65987.1 META domain-containing protein [Leucobacter luti]
MKTQFRAVGALAAAASLFILAGCATSASAPADLAGSWGTPDTRGEPSLNFIPAEDGSAAGQFGGNDGCNTIGGDYTVEGETIEFGAIRATMMYCEGVDTWLSQAHTGTVSGDTLTVLNEQGEQIGTLDRASAAAE